MAVEIVWSPQVRYTFRTKHQSLSPMQWAENQTVLRNYEEENQPERREVKTKDDSDYD